MYDVRHVEMGVETHAYVGWILSVHLLSNFFPIPFQIFFHTFSYLNLKMCPPSHYTHTHFTCIAEDIKYVLVPVACMCSGRGQLPNLSVDISL